MSDDEPPSKVDYLKRASFREANLGPEPTARPPQRSLAFIRNRKRTMAISLVVMGLGTTALVQASHRRELRAQCEREKIAQGLPISQCETSSGGSHSSSSGGSRGFAGSSNSDHAAVSHGGFGSTGSFHFGGGS